MLWQAAFGKPLLDKHVKLELGKEVMGILPMPRYETKQPVKYLASPGNDSTTILGRAGQK